jgi:hypothetical protein
MNNVIDYAISKVSQQIPSALLLKAFTTKDNFNPNQNVSPEYIIRTQIIEQVVIPDMDVLGGQHVVISIGGLPRRYVQNGYFIEIPLELTQGSHLTSVSTTGSSNGGLEVDSSIGGMANSILNVSGGYDSGYTQKVQLVGPNVVFIASNVIQTLQTLSGTIGYDKRLTSLDKFYWNDIAKLVVLATKSIIFSRFIMNIGDLSASGATPNQYLVSMVEGYESAQEEYQTFLDEDITKVLIFADPIANRQHIQMATGRF